MTHTESFILGFTHQENLTEHTVECDVTYDFDPGFQDHSNPWESEPACLTISKILIKSVLVDDVEWTNEHDLVGHELEKYEITELEGDSISDPIEDVLTEEISNRILKEGF